MKKRNIITMFGIALISFFGIVINVNAFSNSLLTSKTTVAPGESVSVTISMSGLTNSLGAINYDLAYNTSAFDYVSTSAGQGKQVQANSTGGVVKLGFFDMNPMANGTFATVNFKAKDSLTSDASGVFTLTSRGATDKDTNDITASSATKTVNIHIKSTVNTLSSLSVTNYAISPAFTSSNVGPYTLTVDGTTSSITVNATKTDNSATLSGNGSKTLAYGSNTINVVVTSESGSSKTYTINVTRPDSRSNDNALKSLGLSAGSLSKGFAASTLKYTATIGSNIENVTINAELNSSKASFVSGYNPRTVKVEMGKTSTFEIRVKSEKGEVKTYSIAITREDNRSKNNYLSSLKITDVEIAFDKNTLEYTVNVPYETEKLTIEAKNEDTKATNSIKGADSLVVGENKVTVEVVAENTTKRVYTIIVNRAEQGEKFSDNNYLSSLSVSGYDITFDKDTLSYSLIIKDENRLNITALPEDENATVSIRNNSNLINGSKIEIVVTAEDNYSKTYTLNIIKETKMSTSTLVLIGGIVLIAIAIILMIVFIIKMKKNKEESISE